MGEHEKLALITLALEAFKAQKGIDFDPSKFELEFTKPNTESYCGIYLVSKRADDFFRIKLYVKTFGNFDVVDNFYLAQEQNYGNGPDDEIHIASCSLSKASYPGLFKYVLSPAFTTEVTATTNRLSTGNDGFLKVDADSYLLTKN